MQRPSSDTIRLPKSGVINEPNFYEMSEKDPLSAEKYDTTDESRLGRHAYSTPMPRLIFNVGIEELQNRSPA